MRAVKNRFGSTNEVVLLEMTGQGLLPLRQSLRGVFGPAFRPEPPAMPSAPSWKGAAPFCWRYRLWPQKPPSASPGGWRRDWNTTAALTIAVLEKVIGLTLSDEDIYLNVTGGLKIFDPTSDLAVAAAICSSHRNTPIGAQTIFWGKSALGGEIRCGGDMNGASVGRIEIRLPALCHPGISWKRSVWMRGEPLSGEKHCGEALFYLEQGVTMVRKEDDAGGHTTPETDIPGRFRGGPGEHPQGENRRAWW